MRGKAIFLVFGSQVHGITPAYAGKSPTDQRLAFSNQDHPRLCGEKTLLINWIDLIPGSPPPMRGKVSHRSAIIKCIRITPAYAGKR